MMMRKARGRTVVWKPVAYEGIEFLTLAETSSGVSAQSVVISVENQVAFRLDYVLTCDPLYVVRGVNLSLASSLALSLASNGQGNWFAERGKPLPELDGCIDVDISATPFTNTLPIRRIQWQVGQSETFRMVYILIPDLTVSMMRQRYTCLEKSDQGATFRYENIDDDFQALLMVDRHGLVQHYEGLFERVV